MDVRVYLVMFVVFWFPRECVRRLPEQSIASHFLFSEVGPEDVQSISQVVHLADISHDRRNSAITIFSENFLMYKL
jgi:hypothetical protein